MQFDDPHRSAEVKLWVCAAVWALKRRCGAHHDNGMTLQEIASRDMKLQNILLEDDEARQRPLLKVTGFGHAKVLLAASQ